MRKCLVTVGVAVALGAMKFASAAPVEFTASGAQPADIQASFQAFRSLLGTNHGVLNGPGNVFTDGHREINWDGVPDASSDPNALPANFFNSNSPRGVVFTTPGTGFAVSANAGGATPVLFGFPSDFQVFTSQKLFTAINSPITDVNFFLPGTATAATTSAFGIVFVDVEVASSTKIQFFDQSNTLIYSRDALVGGNQGLSFVGAVANAGERISRVRITSGTNTIVSNGQLGNQVDDIVVMDDFLFAEPVPEPASLAMLGMAVMGLLLKRRSR